MISSRRTEVLSGILVLTFVIVSAVGIDTHKALAAFGGRTQSGGLTEGLLVEARVTQNGSVIGGKVLIEAGRSEWTTIAMTAGAGGAKKSSPLKLEARANLIDADLVEVETRVTGGREESGKLVVRLGEMGTITTSQMESAEAGAAQAGAAPNAAAGAKADSTSIGVKVLRVRYSL